jgi:twitching motility two-component system response regulator PilH
MENQNSKKRKEILIVEDDHYTNELISSTLKMSGFEVVSVFNGEDAIAAVNERPPDLIVLDLLLPKMDGWEVCRILRKEGAPTRKIPIVIASVVSRFDMEQSEKAMGSLALFNKPFEPTDLIKEVEKMVGAA